MIIHFAPQFQIYFGNAKDQMYPHEYSTWRDGNVIEREAIRPIAERLHLEELFFLRQEHGNKGVILSAESKDTITPFQHAGDFLITNMPHVGIGVVTADCLPVVIYDRKHHASGIAHVGWRGAVAGVVIKMLDAMAAQYKTAPEDCTVFFGPSAKHCCYQVVSDFIDNLEAYSFAQDAIFTHGNAHYFDLPLFVSMQLQQHGISSDAIHTQYNICTICDEGFHSYRRYQRSLRQIEGRQMTIVTIK